MKTIIELRKLANEHAHPGWGANWTAEALEKLTLAVLAGKDIGDFRFKGANNPARAIAAILSELGYRPYVTGWRGGETVRLLQIDKA